MKTENQIIVVGGGPAGMMAAIRASQLQKSVVLIEKNPCLGKKLLLSGKGRCNLTNAAELESFLKRFSRSGQFLRDAFKKFFNHELMEFFETRGLKLKVERQLRVFPETDRADSILEVLKSELHRNKVEVLYNHKLSNVIIENNKVKAISLEGADTLAAERLILATGGVTYPFTGSTGEGIKLAQGCGHRIAPLLPGLTPLETKQKYVKRLEGLTLKNISLRFLSAKKEILTDVGELLFTGKGISGPLVLTASGKISGWLADKQNVAVEVDFKPGLSQEQLDLRFLREFKLAPGKNIGNVLKEVLPGSFIEVFLEELKIMASKKSNQVTQEERKRMVAALKSWRMEILRAAPIKEAMVTLGGVDLRDINPRTMESRIVRGLYFAGEMIDVDADTGGFNLQAAFSTGYLAGESAAFA